MGCTRGHYDNYIEQEKQSPACNVNVSVSMTRMELLHAIRNGTISPASGEQALSQRDRELSTADHELNL